jgi:hypothetical protein
LLHSYRGAIALSQRTKTILADKRVSGMAVGGGEDAD